MLVEKARLSAYIIKIRYWGSSVFNERHNSEVPERTVLE